MRKKYNTYAFTLVELIVGITISMLLMVSVGVFMSGGMQNIFLQQKVFENAGDFVEFNSIFGSTLDNIDTSFPLSQTSSGIIFKSNSYFGNGGITYIGLASTSGFYCTSGDTLADNITQHIFIKNFVPFQDSSSDNDFYTHSVGTYTSYAKQHVIMDGSDIVVGKQTFGDTLGEFGTGTFLNNPTGLAQSGSILFISDTLNNRVLAFDSSDQSMVELLNEDDGLNEPTGLYYDDTNTTLYIANSAAGEILSYSSTIESNYPDVTLTLTGTHNNISEFGFDVYLSGSIVDIGLEQSNFTNLNITDNFYGTGSDDTWEYLFVSYNPVQNNGLCNSAGKIYNGGNPIHCTQNGSGATSNNGQQTISDIQLGNISGTPNIGPYFFDIHLSSGHREYIPYFTQGDGDLLTKDDNTLLVAATGLNYPVYISGNNIPADVGEFDIANAGGYSFSGTYDTILETPVESLGVQINENAGTPELLTLIGSYYKSYDCNNPDRRITREFIWKKNLK